MTRSTPRSKTVFFTIGALIVISALFLALYGKSGSSDRVWNDAALANATIVDQALSIPVSIMRTPAEQERGLSGTPSLPANSGMLFVFSKPDTYGFWMKDMRYPLDLVWINEDHRVVEITTNVSPDTYPHVFYPGEPVSAVLEVNGGFSTAHGLSVGDTLLLKK